MSIIRPFKAYRPKASIVKEVASLPYDVLSSDEARKMTAENEYSFLHVTKAEIDLPRDIDASDKNIYIKARKNLEEMISKELLVQEKKECFYIYRLKMENNQQIGLAVITSIDDYIDDNIKKHEHIQGDKVLDRLKHLEKTEINSDPVFITYKSNHAINKIIADWISENEPLYQFIALDDVEHTLWMVDNDYMINQLISLFKGIDYLYIADGHHLSEAAVKYGLNQRENDPKYNNEDNFNYFLSVLFPHNELCILDYNRVIKDLNGYSNSEFIEILKDKFEIIPHDSDEPYQPEDKHIFGMFLDNQWYKLITKDEVINHLKDPLDQLDVSILRDNILVPILEISNGGRIEYVGGNRGLRELEFRLQDEMKVAFSLYPTSVEDFLEIAGSDHMMPYKSTWFEPKLRSGLFIRNIK